MRQIIYTVAGLLMGCGVLTAQNTADPFGTITQQVLDNNAELRSYRSQTRAQQLNDEADNTLAGPEADFEYLVGPKQVPNRWNVSVTQGFDWPGVYGARKQLAQSRSGQRALQEVAMMNQLRYDVSRQLITAVGIKQEQSMLRAVIANVESLLEATEKQLQHGQATVIDRSKLRFQLISLRDQADACERRLTEVKRQLIALNGGQYVDLDGLKDYPVQPLLTEDEYTKLYADNDFTAQALQADVQVAQAQQRVDRMAAMPGFKAGYAHAYEEGAHFNGLTVGVTLPSWRPSLRRQAAQAQTEAAQLVSDSYSQQRASTLRTQLGEAKRLQALVEQYGREITEDNYVQSLVRLRNAGQITTLDFVTETNYYLDVLRQYLALQTDYNLLLAELNRYN